MRKAILLSKRTSSLPQGLHAPRESHGIHPTKTAKKDKCSTSKAEDNPIVECTKCGALMWTSESTGKDSRTGEPTFTISCNHGQIKLPPIKQPPALLEELLQSRCVVHAPGPYTIRIQGQTHHRIGSLIPRQRRPPEYLQLYIFDTGNKVRNRLNAMGQTSTEGNLDETTLVHLIEMIDENNCLAKLFRRARDYYEGSGQEFNIRLLSDKWNGKEYDLPSMSEVAGLIVGDMSSTIGVRDIVVQFQSDTLQQKRDDHPLYMSLQYPLLFPYGEYGFHPEIPLHLETGTSRTRQFLTIRQYYAAQIQTRLNQGMTLVKGSRLLHQYVVDVFTAIEEDRLRWARNNQYVLRAELYSNVLDVVSKGDTDAKIIGQREYGNPDLFITMTANPNWIEIKEHLERYGGDSPNDRPDIECQVWYVLYRRRRNENESVVKNGSIVNNTFVVPHNIKLLKKYEAHINVEWCNRTSAVKYLFKYITKGVDRASAVIEKGNTATTSDTVASGEPKEKVIKQRNEIQDYIDARYLSACESMWRTFTFHIHKRKPSVEKLIIHLEGEHTITIKATDNLGRVIRKPGIEKTTFTECMVLCRRSSFARTLTYVQIPEYFVWNNSTKVWSERKKGKTIGRIVVVHPSAGDRYYLRILINKIKGPRSYDELKTFNDVKYPDFKSVCHARGYLDDDVEWLESMSEGARTATPYQLRDMFVTFLNNCFVASPKGLWEHSWKSMSEDILHKTQRILGHTNLELDDETLEQYTLIKVENFWNQEIDYDVADETLRHDRGTGKTFIYQTIISRLRSRKQIVLPVASSGIAALLLPNGRTAHSRFNIPLKLDEDKLCNIKLGTMLAELIEKTDLIIWDEAPMTHNHAFEALDKTLKDIMSMKNPPAKNQTFGGKTVLLGGDFRQILPVIPQGSRADTVLALISHSYLWNSCHKFPLKTNMRVNEDEIEFSDWLLKVGEGQTESGQEDEDDGYHDQMIIVDNSLVPEIKDDSLKEVVDAAYGDVNKIEASQSSCTDKAILTPRNDTVDEINAYTISKTGGESKDNYSYDSFEVSETQSNQNDTLYAIEYLNSMEFAGLPSHKLTLKVGAPIMLLWNINKTKELCNGTRMIL
uniref:ATP-dependent DNA helicase n=1 Tax=Brassica oleracea var. oleracea TaxID=109376 RepID=A0A0D3BIS7_BRAOL